MSDTEVELGKKEEGEEEEEQPWDIWLFTGNWGVLLVFAIIVAVVMVTAYRT